MASTNSRKTRTVLGALAAALAITACGGGSGMASNQAKSSGLPQGSETVKLNPADFSTKIDNPYWPMKPGDKRVYRETDPEGVSQRVDVTVTDKTKKLPNGVTARVVHDAVTDGGKPIEITDDYYAQDKAGNIWYLGEATTEFENGKPTSTHGSFEAGKDGAQAGIALPAKPKPGLTYRQEYYKGQAEDKAVIGSLKEQAEVPAGHFKPVLMTKDLNPLKPKALEYKFYAKGVGPVLEVGISGGADRAELVKFTPGK